MAAADDISYPADSDWRGPEAMLLKVAASVFHISFGVLAVVAIVGGVVSGSAGPVVFGIFLAVAYGSITWSAFHLASPLEFSGGRLSWRTSLPWFPRMRTGRVRAIRWPASPRSRYVRIELDDGRKLSVLPRRGLMEFINRVHAVEPGIIVDVRLSGHNSKWMSTESAGYISQRARDLTGRRGFRIPVSIAVSLVLLAVVAEFALLGIGAQENFKTLRTDLAQVHLPSEYRLTTEHRAGTDCAHDQCSLTQTWRWPASSGHAKSAACSDVLHAMTSAFSGVDSNSPLPANAACDYYTILSSLLHPGQGKRTIEAIVTTGQSQTRGVGLVELIASY